MLPDKKNENKKCFKCVALEIEHSDHLKALNAPLRAGLSSKLTPPYTYMDCPSGVSNVANLCITKGYPKSTPERLTFNEDTY